MLAAFFAVSVAPKALRSMTEVELIVRSGLSNWVQASLEG